MTKRFPRTQGMVLAALLILAGVTKASGFSFRSDSPRLYLIQGYLDQAPKDAKVIDRVEIAASGERSRQLLVTSYRSPGVLLDYRSREPMLPYHVIGNPAYVFRLLEAPQGTQIEGTFAIYAQAVPSLLILSLDIPASGRS